MVQIKRDALGPVGVEQLKNHLHIMTCNFDESLYMTIRAAVAKAETYTNSRIWHSTLSCSVPFERKIVVKEPTAIVTSVKVDDNEVNFTYSENVIHIEESGKMVEYTAVVGYSPEDCPADIQMAIMLIAAKMFSNPVDSVENLPSASQNLLHPYKNYCL